MINKRAMQPRCSPQSSGALMKALACIAAVASLAAFPALAGPAGHGQTHTEAVAKQHLAKRTVKIETAAACAAPAANTVSQRQDVAAAKAQGGIVHVVFHTADAAANQESAVRAAISDVCRAA